MNIDYPFYIDELMELLPSVLTEIENYQRLMYRLCYENRAHLISNRACSMLDAWTFYAWITATTKGVSASIICSHLAML